MVSSLAVSDRPSSASLGQGVWTQSYLPTLSHWLSNKNLNFSDVKEQVCAAGVWKENALQSCFCQAAETRLVELSFGTCV